MLTAYARPPAPKRDEVALRIIGQVAANLVRPSLKSMDESLINSISRRLHGALSTGPKTPEGIERIRRAVTKHGRYTAVAKAEQREYCELLKRCRVTLADIGAKGCSGTASKAESVSATVARWAKLSPDG
jgi:hypothetical protein